MIKRFCDYIDRVFNFGNQIKDIKDNRELPEIPTKNIWLSGLFMFVLRLGSLNAVDTELQLPKRMEKLIGKRKPSGDSIGRVFTKTETDGIRNILCKINHKLKRNKRLKTNWPLRFVGIDGHELFSSRSRCCDKCLMRKINVKGEEVIEYYHRVVACHLIGFDLALPLDVEPILPGEGEVIAGKRLLERVFKNYSRFFDGIVGDGLYLEAPFFNFCIKHNKYVIAVLKSERRILMQDAEGVFKTMEPIILKEKNLTAKIWDCEGFESMEGVKTKIRVLHSEEKEIKRIQKGGEWIEKQEEHNWWWATNIPAYILPAKLLWRAGHNRWDIENDLFNDLVNHWDMNHCFKHEPNAIMNFLLTLFIAFVLMQSFYKLNIKPQLRSKFSLISIAIQFITSLASYNFIAIWCVPLTAT
jgi:hypothetical protein